MTAPPSARAFVDHERLAAENQELRLRLEEAEQALEAIRTGQVDSLIVEGPEGPRVFSLEGTDESYRVLVEAINEGAATFGEDGTVFYCNGRFAGMLEAPLERVMGGPIARFLPEGSREGFAALVREAGGGQSRGELELLTQAGQLVPVYLSLSVVADGGRRRLCCVATDLRAQKRTEELFRAERLARSVLEQAAEAVVVCDEQARVVRASGAAVELCGRDPRLAPFDATYPVRLEVTDAEPELSLARRALGGERLRSVPASLELGERGRAHLLVSAAPLTGGSGEVLGCVISMTDITDRKRAEEALRSSRAKLEAALASMVDAVLISDAEGRFLKFNEAFASFHRFKNKDECAETLASQPDLLEVSFPSGEVAPVEMRAVTRALRGETVTGAEYGLRRKDTGESWVGSYSFAPIRDEAGAIVGSVVVGRDVTPEKRAAEERAKLEQQLHHAQKLESVGRLAGGVAHEFNNMLGVILGYTELALGQVATGEPLRDDLEEVRGAARRSADLTRQLLTFARKQAAAPKVLDLNETVGGMLRMLRQLIGEDILLAWQPGAELWPVKVDPSQVDQIVANLCVNARDAIRGAGRVEIETANVTFDTAYCAAHPGFLPGDYVRLSVRDDGCGMDEEAQSHAFEPFFTTKEPGKGTGLGLAAVHGAVSQNQGFVQLTSTPGMGTTFAVHLPRHAQKGEGARRGLAAVPAPRGDETVLLVEDEPAILRFSRRVLEGQGYTVLGASSPGEALRMAREHAGEIHLLVTDVVMPESNGRDLAEALIPLRPALRLIFMSGYTADIIAANGVLGEGVTFLQKPFSATDLAAKVRAVLDEPRARDAAPAR